MHLCGACCKRRIPQVNADKFQSSPPPLVSLFSPPPNFLVLVPFAGILPPIPNINYPSPAKYMNDGCIHASKEGWHILMSKLYENFFASRL
eukprot:m.109269 g.109269  ORF g.109269 m.109269 type:complete len:91 (+) comp22675_c0_seq4:668-940(+)